MTRPHDFLGTDLTEGSIKIDKLVIIYFAKSVRGRGAWDRKT